VYTYYTSGCWLMADECDDDVSMLWYQFPF
jgi:hypothetical protein